MFTLYSQTFVLYYTYIYGTNSVGANSTRANQAIAQNLAYL